MWNSNRQIKMLNLYHVNVWLLRRSLLYNCYFKISKNFNLHVKEHERRSFEILLLFIWTFQNYLGREIMNLTQMSYMFNNLRMPNVAQIAERKHSPRHFTFLKNAQKRNSYKFWFCYGNCPRILNVRKIK
jgi:hypothetical protein